MTEMYSDKADGLCGNEDVGQMSAWYLLTAVGLYQVEPSGGRFVIGSPIVDKATLRVGQGRSFTILARNNSKENIYVETARLNGKKLRRPYLTFEEITSGGSLELTMTNRPTNWVGGIED